MCYTYAHTYMRSYIYTNIHTCTGIQKHEEKLTGVCRQMSTLRRRFEKWCKGDDIEDCTHKKTAGKWQKCESYVGALTPWLAAWAGHELGGSAPHQCR